MVAWIDPLTPQFWVGEWRAVLKYLAVIVRHSAACVGIAAVEVSEFPLCFHDFSWKLNCFSKYLVIATTSLSCGLFHSCCIADSKTQRTHGRQAQIGNIAAARAVADIIRSTLGPRSMLKVRDFCCALCSFVENRTQYNVTVRTSRKRCCWIRWAAS